MKTLFILNDPPYGTERAKNDVYPVSGADNSLRDKTVSVYHAPGWI